MDSFSPPAATDSEATAPGQPSLDMIFQIINNNWYHWGNKYETYVQNPDKIPVEEYDRMLETDETVFAGYEYLVQSVIARIGEYSHPDEVIEGFVQQNLTKMKGSFLNVCGESLSAVGYGFSVGEVVWTRKSFTITTGDKGAGTEQTTEISDAIAFDRIQFLHPSDVFINTHKEGPAKNEPSMIRQHLFNGEHIDLPMNKVMLYSHGAKFGNVYGKSRLKRAYKSWFIKEVMLRAWGVANERHGKPHTIAKANLDGNVQDPANPGTIIPYAQYLASVLDGLANNGSCIVNQTTDVSIVRAAAGMGKDFGEIIQYCNRSILMAIGLPSLLLDGGSVGSYSLGKEQGDRFNQLLEAILIEFTDVLIEQLIRPLIDYNFGEQSDYGYFGFEEWNAEDQLTIVSAIEKLTNTGYLSKDRYADQCYVRERAGVPPITQAEMETDFPAMDVSGLGSDEATPDAESGDGLPAELSERSRVFTFSAISKLRRRKRNEAT